MASGASPRVFHDINEVRLAVLKVDCDRCLIATGTGLFAASYR